MGRAPESPDSYYLNLSYSRLLYQDYPCWDRPGAEFLGCPPSVWGRKTKKCPSEESKCRTCGKARGRAARERERSRHPSFVLRSLPPPALFPLTPAPPCGWCARSAWGRCSRSASAAVNGSPTNMGRVKGRTPEGVFTGLHRFPPGSHRSYFVLLSGLNQCPPVVIWFPPEKRLLVGDFKVTLAVTSS